MTADRCELLCLDFEKAERLRKSLIDLDTAELAARRAKALGDPTRFTLAAVLADTDEICVCDAAWIVGRAENLVSHHLRVLRAEGLATGRREGKMVMYSATADCRALLPAVQAPELAG